MEQPTAVDPQAVEPQAVEPQEPVDTWSPDDEDFERYGETTANYLFQPEPW